MISKMLVLMSCLLMCTETPIQTQSNGTIDIVAFSGAVGDGVVDDTAAVQTALTECSNNGLTCVIPANTKLLITNAVYMWGGANIVGTDATSEIVLSTGSIPYIVNIGISGPHQLEAVWTGTIKGVKFRGIGPGTGRILFFWRVNGAAIVGNFFDIGEFRYGPTSSGNNNNIVVNGHINTVRKNIVITDNIVTAKGTNIGNEGIGLNQWDGAVIARNIVSGVGDDMIGIHFSKNINIHNNFLAGVDGRLFVSNTKSFVVNDNWVERISSPLNGQWYPGISLIYIGHEGDATNNFSAPSDFTVRGNILVYNSGAVDNGAAIYVYGPRNGLVDSNSIMNNSSLTTAVGLQLLPFLYSAGTWTDPDDIDPLNISRVHNITISKNNFSSGTFSMIVKETGNTCANYIGPVTISDNVAGDYQFICSPTTVNNLIK